MRHLVPSLMDSLINTSLMDFICGFFILNLMLLSHEFFRTLLTKEEFLWTFSMRWSLAMNPFNELKWFDFDPFNESFLFVKIEAWFDKTHLLFWIWLGSNPFMNLVLDEFLPYSSSSSSYFLWQRKKETSTSQEEPKAFVHLK